MKKFLLALGVLLALASPAAAQTTCKYIAYGAVLTPGQWNYCFSVKNDTLGYTPVNKAGDTMLGKLTTIAPSTAAGFNLPPASAPGAPVNGDLWTTTSGLFGRINGSTVQFLSPGITSPSPITVNRNTSSLQAAQTGSLFQGQQADGTPARAELDAFNAQSFFSGVIAGGTKASPTAVTSGTQLTGINAFAFNGASFVGPIVSFRTYAAENIASGHQGSQACIATTPTASTTLADGLCQNASSGVTLGSPTGGDKGASTLNAAGSIYVNNVLLDSISASNTLSNKTLASPIFTGTVTTPITGSTQCLQVNSSGVIAGSTTSCPLGTMTVQDLTSGSGATYTTPAGTKMLRIRMWGGGGAGGSNSNNGFNGGLGGTTTFNSINANGGSGGGFASGAGTGGTGGTGSATIRAVGNTGDGGVSIGTGFTTSASGGIGAAGPLGGRPGSGASAAANTGAGGSGGAGSSFNGTTGGAGGSPEYVEIIINNPSPTYTFTIGAGGVIGGGTPGSFGFGGNGGSGRIIVEQYS
jgi:hypothetical protein